MKFLNIIFLVFLITSCSGISMMTGPTQSDLYTSDFLKKIDEIKKYYAAGESAQALAGLGAIDEQNLLPTEQALKENLTGVILFSRGEFDDAQSYFEKALLSSRLDETLTAQIYLNLGSVQYKLANYQKAFNTLDMAKHEFLKGKEFKKFHHLKYKLAELLGKNRDALNSLVPYLSSYENMNELKNDPYFAPLADLFNQLEPREKIRFFESFGDNKYFVLGYLAYLEGERLYYSGRKEDGKDLLNWAIDRYKQYPEIDSLISSFLNRLDNFSKIDKSAIGVVLPLSGEKKGFGKRALLGIDLAIQEINKTSEIKYKLYIKDSEGSGAAGAYRVKELVEDHAVSAVIGGLFSKEAEKEFEEAKKNGVFFVSLSQVFIAKELKNHLLLEMPGSVESLVSRLFSKEMLELFGKRAAIVYPDSIRGKAYLDEFWRKAQIHEVQVSGIVAYNKGQTDFRPPVRQLLGLNFPRQRKEELEILEEVYALEKKGSIRRIQKLDPVIDFDWIFIPSYPKESVQILPSFGYYDAFGLNIIGGPSWRSRSVVEGNNSKYGDIFFVGDSVDSNAEQDFVKFFGAKYKMRAGLIELRSYDAMNIISNVVSQGDYQSRDELDIAIRSRDALKGQSGTWRIEDGVWTKDMSPLKIKRNRVENIFENEKVN